uniref:Tubulin-specific chaperone C n=1 Tax=Caligus rogercresseyi TaxID=217165 RepID=C1BNN4_CALRO|nr:Tubulin-specific chaperone C [Caligus rogercresseyi]
MSQASSFELQAHLNDRIQDLQKALQDKEDITSKLCELDTKIKDFEALFSEKAHFLPSYDVKKLQTAILAIKASYQRHLQSTQPKKRFAFKSRTSMKTREEINTLASDAKAAVQKVYSTKNTAKVTLGDKENESLVLDSGEMDPLISRLRGCKVHLRTYVPSTVHLTDLEDCVVVFGPVRTSVFVERCRNTVFYLYCQQLRMHESKDCSVYLHVTCKGIIEDCHGIRFAPYPETPFMEDLKELKASSGLSPMENHWDEIQDFNWLSPDQASPNWSIIPSENRKSPTL